MADHYANTAAIEVLIKVTSMRLRVGVRSLDCILTNGACDYIGIIHNLHNKRHPERNDVGVIKNVSPLLRGVYGFVPF